MVRNLCRLDSPVRFLLPRRIWGWQHLPQNVSHQLSPLVPVVESSPASRVALVVRVLQGFFLFRVGMRKLVGVISDHGVWDTFGFYGRTGSRIHRRFLAC